MIKKKRKITIVAWGDGFEMVISAVSKNNTLKDLIKKIIVINPSILDNGMSGQTYDKKIAYYDDLLKKKIYSTVRSSEILKVKTLSDMMILKPDGSSPFSKDLGYEDISNKEVLQRYLKEKDLPLLSFSYKSSEYSMNDIRDIYMQPVPLFNMAVPVVLMRDINQYWAEAADKVKKEKKKISVDFPLTILYSESFAKNAETIIKYFEPESGIEKIKLDSISTIEIIMSKSARAKILNSL